MVVLKAACFRWLCAAWCTCLLAAFWTPPTSAEDVRPVVETHGFHSHGEADERHKGVESPRYTQRKNHDPNGIGKFYMGREIARVMGFAGIKWLERPKREPEEKLSLLVEALQVKPGMVVADIGAGSGVVSLLLAEKVGPEGKVIAVDIQAEMLDALRKKLEQRSITNVELVRGTRKSPRLPPASVDLAIMVDVYHEFDFPFEMTRELAAAIKQGGRIAAVEYRKEDPDVRRLIKLVHTMTEAQVKKEIGRGEFGLKWKKTIGVLPRQHVVVFERVGKKQPTLQDRPRRHRAETLHSNQTRSKGGHGNRGTRSLRHRRFGAGFDEGASAGTARDSRGGSHGPV